MRRWHEEHDRSGNGYERMDSSMRSHDDRGYDDSRRWERGGRSDMSGRPEMGMGRRPDIAGSSDMRGRMDYEGPMQRQFMDRQEYRQDQRREEDSYGRGNYGHGRQERSSQGEMRQGGNPYERGDRGDSSHRFMYDNRGSDFRQERDMDRYQERRRDEYPDRARYGGDDDDWDDRPRISGPVRLDATDIRQSRERHEREAHGRMQGSSRAEDFEQYRGRDAGFSWTDGSNSAVSHDYDRWGSEYNNHSRSEGFGWNRGSTRDPHFWSSPDRER